MKKISFNDGWICYRTGQKEETFPVTLPHDAMLLDERKAFTPSGVNAGWIDAQDYTYEKTFYVPAEYESQYVQFEFEGAYHKATVYINGIKAAYQDYGYLGFYVETQGLLRYGEKNQLRVEVINSDQPNCRWYSGTGLYRPVWMHLMPPKHIELEQIKIRTLSYQNPRIGIQVKTNAPGPLKIEILDGDHVMQSVEGMTQGIFEQDLDLPEAKIWSGNSPNLYTCRVTFGENVQEERFGIRTVEWSPDKGLHINGERVILRGACIHHDNGLLGACAYDYAEARKIRILKENGYNAIRSAHNPCSKAMLKACDEQGMYVMDEYVDVWYIHKNKYDYASSVEANYRDDLRRIVDKDYNHPSVIMYSTGNEVAESGQKRGIVLCEAFTEYLHELDPGRPVTCGINIFFNFLSSMGFGVYSDKKAEQELKNAKKKKAVGSEFFNKLAGLLGADFMKTGATLYPCDVKTRDAFARMDMAGYNYGIFRYKHDLKKYPDRMILGTETFCSDAYRFWELAKKEKRIVGDFVWAGMDYLGEVGIGSWEYQDYAPDFSNGLGWVSAGSGRIDLTGKPLAEMSYTRVAFELDQIGMGVIPVNNADKKHSPSAWKMTNAIESWSWNGCDGKETKVEVYARADQVSLFVNGTCVGTKRPEKDCRVVFKTTYHSGEIKAIAYDKEKRIIAEKTLRTAGDDTILTLEPEEARISAADGLCYLRLRYTDGKGITKPLERGIINLQTEGGTLLAFGSACPYYPGSYLSDSADTYYGEALAVIRPDGPGRIRVRAESEYGIGTAEIEVI